MTEWTKTYTNLAGYPVKIECPDGAFASKEYNDLGQLVKESDPDGVVTLYAYNGKGEREVTAIDLDQDGVIDYGGIDRITQVVRDVASKSGGVIVDRATTRVWATDNAATATVVSISEQDGYGNRSWQTDGSGAVTMTQTIYTGGGTWTVTTTNPDLSQTVQTYTNGRLASTAQKDNTGATISSKTYGYDTHGRLQTETDARTGTTGYTYYDNDQIHTTTTPAPAPGEADLVTTNTYDRMGRLTEVELPDGGVTHTD